MDLSGVSAPVDDFSWSPTVSADDVEPASTPASSGVDDAAAAVQAQVAAALNASTFAPPAEATPDAIAPKRVTQPELPSGTGLSYGEVSGPLFKGPPTPQEAVQGGLGDCFYVASLAAVAEVQPEAIKQGISDNGDGTYSVRVFGKTSDGTFVPQLFQVNGEVPVAPGVGQVFTQSEDGSRWASLYEKGFAAANEGYANIDGGIPPTALEAITGKPASWTNIEKMSPNEVWGVLQGAGTVPMVAGTEPVRDDDPYYASRLGVRGLVPGHGYTVLGTSTEEGQRSVLVRNPWGQGEPANAKGMALDGVNDGVFKVRIEDFSQYFSFVAKGGLADVAPARPGVGG